ncbi:MAG: ThuA domain-containing protein [Planctomycetota bacterium]|jgi:trehalose utilization protein
MAEPIKVTVWNEHRHEKKNKDIAKIYPEGMHGAIAAGLNAVDGVKARTATLDEPEHGLTEEVLADTDVLTWWGHMAHKDVDDAIVDRVQGHVISGMGIVLLHSAHFSKIFRRLMGTTCSLKWREAGEREILWNTKPGHPITEGLPDPIIIEHTEMYGEFFDVPEPEATIFISNFAGGEVFRSGCVWTRGAGKVFYFRPGHETFPIFHDPTIHKVLANAVRWMAPAARSEVTVSHRGEIGWFEK